MINYNLVCTKKQNEINSYIKTHALAIKDYTFIKIIFNNL